MLKPKQCLNDVSSPRYVKQKKGVQFVDAHKLEAMMMLQVGFEGK